MGPGMDMTGGWVHSPSAPRGIYGGAAVGPCSPVLDSGTQILMNEVGSGMGQQWREGGSTNLTMPGRELFFVGMEVVILP